MMGLCVLIFFILHKKKIIIVHGKWSILPLLTTTIFVQERFESLPRISQYHFAQRMGLVDVNKYHLTLKHYRVFALATAKFIRQNL